MASASAVQVVDERFSHPVVRAALLNLAGAIGPIDEDGTGMAFVGQGIIHFVGLGRPIGGMQTFVDALAASFKAKGGEVRTGRPVSEIQVSNGRARGVLLADGSTISARAVLSSADPYTTLRRLLPEGTLDRQTTARVDHIPASSRVAIFKVDMALSGQATIPNHNHPSADLRQAVLLYGTEEMIDDTFACAKHGELCEDPFLWASIGTAVDGSQAPEGQDVVYLYQPAMPGHPSVGWDVLSPVAEKITLDSAGKFLGRLEELEIGRWVESPQDLFHRVGAWKGTLLHVDFALTRSGPLRPAWGLGNYRTPVDGLFLGGSGSHPGGTVSGLPGKLSSRRVERHLKKSSAKR